MFVSNFQNVPKRVFFYLKGLSASERASVYFPIFSAPPACCVSTSLYECSPVGDLEVGSSRSSITMLTMSLTDAFKGVLKVKDAGFSSNDREAVLPSPNEIMNYTYFFL